eukprot:TRINITY_DN10427_c0_g1_i1.p1 TRINITY_DN10427_c0_g1~~TRINITY_DN10427_c0_g1_i1.p1  ORF type:complete len:145 (-),score=17.32 TRINITY_DN10427_c0_g1_i1:34-468(-)
MQVQQTYITPGQPQQQVYISPEYASNFPPGTVFVPIQTTNPQATYQSTVVPDDDPQRVATVAKCKRGFFQFNVVCLWIFFVFMIGIGSSLAAASSEAGFYSYSSSSYGYGANSGIFFAIVVLLLIFNIVYCVTGCRVHKVCECC